MPLSFLSYGSAPKRKRGWLWRVVALALLVALLGYGFCWVHMASRAGGIEMISGNSVHHLRIRPYPDRGWQAVLFEPAYQIDLWLRPVYWSSFEVIMEGP